MMVYERGDVIREVWSMSVSIAPSVSGGSSTDFQKRCQPCGTDGSNIDCSATYGLGSSRSTIGLPNSFSGRTTSAPSSGAPA